MGKKRFTGIVFLILLFIGGAYIGLFHLFQSANSSKKLKCYRCNIVLITIDPLRHDELPCYGYTRNTAENICRLADRSHLFENAFSQSSWTLPSIMSLFSSRYPTQHRMFTPNQDVLAPSLVTLPQALKKNGYHTVYVGTTTDSHVPLDKGIGRGFDTIIPYESIDTATQTLDDLQQKSPFFLFVHSFDLRVSATKVNSDQKFIFDPTFTLKYEPPQPGADPKKDTPQNIKFLRNMYDQRLYELDKKIASLLTKLKQNNQTQKTIIVITSNHGDEFGEHGKTSHSTNLYDTVTHIPLIISIPGAIPDRNEALVQSIDIYPTLLALIGGKTANLTGKNILAEKHSDINPFSISQLEPIKHLNAIRSKQWALYMNEPPNQQTTLELYNLLIDPTEQTNVANTYPDIVNTLRQTYEKTIQ